MLASGLAGLQPYQTLSQADRFQEQLSAANTELMTALVLLQAGQNKVHTIIEDAVVGQPSSVLLSDQGAAQSLDAQYQEQIAAFIRGNLFSQHPSQAEWLNELGQGEAIERQQGLVISVTYSWQRYHAAQAQVFQDILARELHAAETAARDQADPMDTDVLSALYNLMQFESNLALSVQNAAHTQAQHYQQIGTLLAASVALLLILTTGFLVIISLLGPLQRLRQATQAFSSGEAEARVAVVGRDEIATISWRVNDMLATIDSLLAEISRQHHGLVSAAEHLFSHMSGEDGSAVRLKLAEVGDPLQVLDAICSDVVARFQHVALATRKGVRHLENTAQRTYIQAKKILLDYPGTQTGFAQEVIMATRELESITRDLTQALPRLREDEAIRAEEAPQVKSGNSDDHEP